jgi:hypothetical protein
VGRRIAFKGILLTLTSYPEPIPVSRIDDAVSIAAALGAHLAHARLREFVLAGATKSLLSKPPLPILFSQ